MIFNKKMAVYSSAIFFVVLDRFLKSLAMEAGNDPVEIVGSVLRFSLAKNHNIAFSIPIEGLILNISIAAIIASLIMIFAKSLKEGREESYAFSFVILGAMSNFYDRIAYGAVIDYLDLSYFTVFNIADMMIVFSTAVLLLGLIKSHE